MTLRSSLFSLAGFSLVHVHANRHACVEYVRMHDTRVPVRMHVHQTKAKLN
jgi:uncharacterized protein YbdZ (MbtH family)